MPGGRDLRVGHTRGVRHTGAVVDELLETITDDVLGHDFGAPTLGRARPYARRSAMSGLEVESEDADGFVARARVSGSDPTPYAVVLAARLGAATGRARCARPARARCASSASTGPRSPWCCARDRGAAAGAHLGATARRRLARRPGGVGPTRSTSVARRAAPARAAGAPDRPAGPRRTTTARRGVAHATRCARAHGAGWIKTGTTWPDVRSGAALRRPRPRAGRGAAPAARGAQRRPGTGRPGGAALPGGLRRAVWRLLRAGPGRGVQLRAQRGPGRPRAARGARSTSPSTWSATARVGGAGRRRHTTAVVVRRRRAHGAASRRTAWSCCVSAEPPAQGPGAAEVALAAARPGRPRWPSRLLRRDDPVRGAGTGLDRLRGRPAPPAAPRLRRSGRATAPSRCRRRSLRRCG